MRLPGTSAFVSLPGPEKHISAHMETGKAHSRDQALLAVRELGFRDYNIGLQTLELLAPTAFTLMGLRLLAGFGLRQSGLSNGPG